MILTRRDSADPSPTTPSRRRMRPSMPALKLCTMRAAMSTFARNIRVSLCPSRAAHTATSLLRVRHTPNRVCPGSGIEYRGEAYGHHAYVHRCIPCGGGERAPRLSLRGSAVLRHCHYLLSDKGGGLCSPLSSLRQCSRPWASQEHDRAWCIISIALDLGARSSYGRGHPPTTIYSQ